MCSWHHYALIGILGLLLAGCGAPASTTALSAPLAAQPTATRQAISAEASIAPPTAAPGTNAMAKTPPADCPVTRRPARLFVPPAPYPRGAPSSDTFWYGTPALWTEVPNTGVWWGLPHNREGYTQKIFWWREGYVWTEEPEPQLAVTGRRLDAAAAPLNVSRATNAFASDIGSAMLVGVDFPTLGCWEITGRYADAELSFVVWVAP